MLCFTEVFSKKDSEDYLHAKNEGSLSELSNVITQAGRQTVGITYPHMRLVTGKLAGQGTRLLLAIDLY